jgi:hypothetical protein
MPSAVQQGNAAFNEPPPCLLLVAEPPAVIPTVKAIRMNPAREERVRESDNVSGGGP